MKKNLIFILTMAAGALGLIQNTGAAPNDKPAFNFAGTAYFHRWSKDNQHEFTPAKQEDLEKWTDMLTLDPYPDVHDGDALAAKANAVLENYKAHKGVVVRTDSAPRTPERPAEHLIVVVFGQPHFIEVAFTRCKLADGRGYSIVYSHRIYGEKVGDQMSAWLKDNGPAIEKTLLAWNSIPKSLP